MDLFTYLMAKKGHNTGRDLFSYLLGKNNQLSSEYQRLEYIESTGTQYIDTGVNADDINYAFYIDFYGYQTQPSQYPRVFGYQYQGGIFLANKFWYGDNTNTNATDVFGTLNDERHSIFANKDYAIVDSVKYNLNTPPTSITKFNSNKIAIFSSFHGNTGAIRTSDFSKIKLYSFKIYHNNKLIRNFIPCMRKTDNEVGLYDTVGKQFYTNQGTGKFAYKGYSFIEYIGSTGTQYIDTGILTNNNISVDIKFRITTLQNVLQLLGAIETDKSITVNVGNSNTAQNRWGTALKSTPLGLSDNTTYVGDFSKNGYIINDSNKWTPTENEFEGTKNIYVFTANGSTFRFYGRIYYCKIWNKGTLVRNFIPAIRNSDNAIGLYDIVNDTFYENVGTGTFVIPNNIQLNSIQSLNTSLLSQNINNIQNEEETNIDDVNEIEDIGQNDELIEEKI